MGNIIKGVHRIGNGTDYDVIYSATTADMIVEGVLTTEEELNNATHYQLVSAKLTKDMLEKKVNISDLTNRLEFKGSTTYESLPASDNNTGDFYYVEDRSHFYTWNGSAWIDTGDGYGNVVSEEEYNNTISELKGDLVNESLHRESLAESVGSKLKHGINFFDSTDLEGKKFSDIAIDNPNGSWSWMYNCKGLIAEDIPSGSYVLLEAFDNSGNLIPQNDNFYFLIIDTNGKSIGELYSNKREQIQYDIPKGSKIRIELSKNHAQYKDTIFSGITFLKQTFDGTNQIFKPTISEYVPYEENYINNNGVVYIGNNTNFNIKNGLAYAVENNLTAIINKGVYDLVSEGISGEGNKLPKHLIGYGVTLKADLPTENWDWSPLNVDMNRDETIVEGLTIEVSNCRYCIHDEMYNRAEPYHNVFKNLRLVHKTGATSTLIAPHCIGGGLGNGGIIEIENVITSANLYKDISYHSCAGTPTIVNRVYLKDSIVKHCVEVSDVTPATPYVEQFVNKVYVSNCILGRQPITDVDGHIQIVAWNNTINTNADTN